MAFTDSEPGAPPAAVEEPAGKAGIETPDEPSPEG